MRHSSIRLTTVLSTLLFVCPLAFAQANLVTNPGFDGGLSGWMELTDTDHYQWDSADASSSPSSGSVKLSNFGGATTVEVGQCIALASVGTYQLGGRLFIDDASDGLGDIGFGARFFRSPNCTGSNPQTGRTLFRDNYPVGQWRLLEGFRSNPLEVPPDVVSVQMYVFIDRTGGTQIIANFDDVYLRQAGELGPLPRISFSASPRTIRSGQSTTLLWTTRDATSVSIDHGVGSQPVNGSVSVSPASSTTYTLTATGPGGTATAQASVEVITTPEVSLVALPDPLVQDTDVGGATTEFVLANAGGASTSVNLSIDGDFFQISPTSFTLPARQIQRVTVTGLASPAGAFRGRVIPSGAGVPPNTDIPIRLLSIPEPTGTAAAEPETSRLDVSGPSGSNPSGSARFRNTGNAKIQGTLVSTVPWLIPQPGLIEIDPSSTVEVSFTIDRAKRPADAGLGSLEGKLLLVFRTGSTGKTAREAPRNGTSTTSSLVTIVDTSAPPVQPGEIPPLAPNEVAIFIPGVGHVEGSTGLFFSDLSLINLTGGSTLDDIEMYFTPLGEGESSLVSSIGGLSPSTSIALADVVKTVFDREQIGSLQIRVPDVSQLAVNANILSRTRQDRKTFGATIPMLRSDRSFGPGENSYITGLRRTSGSHTNLFVQETSGGELILDIDFLDESANRLGGLTEVTVGPFRLAGFFHSDSAPILPLGAVSAVIKSRDESTGRFAAYATPVDRESGDFWSLVEWNAQNDFSGNDSMLIPVAGAVLGANDLNFRTDIAVINRDATQGSGIFRYIPRLEEGRAPIDKSIALGPAQSAILEDAMRTLFEFDISESTLGFMTFTPQSGEMAVTSRNFATVGNDPGTFGTGVATLALDSSLRLGDIRRIGGIKDSSIEAIDQRIPGTFRSNFAMMETTGTASVTVRVTLHFTYSSGSLAGVRGSASKEYVLQPNQFVQLGRISAQILGESRDDFGDFDNLQAEFSVIEGDGAAAVFVSSVENDTGDSILRVQ